MKTQLKNAKLFFFTSESDGSALECTNNENPPENWAMTMKLLQQVKAPNCSQWQTAYPKRGSSVCKLIFHDAKETKGNGCLE